MTEKDHEGAVETTLLVADLLEPEGSVTVQEKAYGIPVLENMALVTVTLILTAEDGDSKILFGVNTIVYDSPAALVGLIGPRAMSPTMKIEQRTSLDARIRN